jgi:hypothetical protein
MISYSLSREEGKELWKQPDEILILTLQAPLLLSLETEKGDEE